MRIEEVIAGVPIAAGIVLFMLVLWSKFMEYLRSRRSAPPKWPDRNVVSRKLLATERNADIYELTLDCGHTITFRCHRIACAPCRECKVVITEELFNRENVVTK